MGESGSSENDQGGNFEFRGFDAVAEYQHHNPGQDSVEDHGLEKQEPVFGIAVGAQELLNLQDELAHDRIKVGRVVRRRGVQGGWPRVYGRPVAWPSAPSGCV